MSCKNTESLKKSKLSLVGVVVLVYSFIAAGAFGIEEAISASGPGVTLVMLILFPIFWSFPISEMVGELSSLYPTEGGIYVWGKEAFGEFWGWQVGFWSAITTWLCQAQYCALVVGYVAKIVNMSPTSEYLLKILMVLIFTVINLFGLTWIEKIETVLISVVLIAFAAVTIVGFLNWNFNPIQPFFNKELGLFHSVGESIAIIIWMFCGYECMSNMAEEVDDPQVISKAMRLSQPLVALSYVLPTLAALAAIGSWSAWSTESSAGHIGYADVLIQYVGSWSGVLFIIVAIISNCTIFCSYIAHGSRAFFVMADDNMFPKIMNRVDKRGIPSISIIFLAIFTIITCKFDFKTLVMATVPIELFIYLMLIACVFKIRSHYPIEKRKKLGLIFMPGGKMGLILLSFSVFAICMFALYASGIAYFLTGLIILSLGLVAYILCKWKYKGRYLDNPKAYPLNEKTKLGLGDLMDIGVYVFITGLLSFIGSIFMFYYEGEDAIEWYLQEYEAGLLSDFTAMVDLCKYIGIGLIIVGIAIYMFGKKSESEKIKELHEIRKEELKSRIEALHDILPEDQELNAKQPQLSEEIQSETKSKMKNTIGGVL